MKRANRILLAVGFLALIIISWAIVLNSKSNSEKQAELLTQAMEYIEDEVYILALPLLEEAAGYNAARTVEVETVLKDVYIQLIEQRGYRRKYIDLLEKQMNRKDTSPEIFIEAANFYLENSKFKDAYTVLKNGIAKTGSDELVTIYEENRYLYKMNYSVYTDVTSFHGTTIGVQINGFWGIAGSNGALQIPCEYQKISTYSNDRAIVQKDNLIIAIDKNNNRIAKLNESASDFGNFANDRIPLLIEGKWYRATGKFDIGSTVFEQIGTYFNGYAAAKQNGKWGVIDSSNSWLIPAEYDGIIMDELGRSYAQGAAFVIKGDSVYLFVDGKQIGEAYEDAKPFSNEGYAAVKKNGMWGFINIAGELKINYKFEDALSFGQHLAAFKIVIQDEFYDMKRNEDDEQIEPIELWGYISLNGDVVIEPIFLQAKSFAGGSAPVLTKRGWQFISLLEY